MWVGAVHDRIDVPIDGGLAMFCPACPQVDINIPRPTEWKSEDRYENLKTTQFVTGITQITLSTSIGCWWEYEIGPPEDEVPHRRCVLI